ncbi:flagellar motor switch phosphatase FliY [Oceanobacillus sp. CAU 1775]
MNDGMLSQDEIDALLNIGDDKEEENNKSEVSLLTDIEIDTIGEIGNISFGSSATTLSMLLNQRVEITTPTVSVIEKKDLSDEFNFQPVSVQVDYTKGFSGRNIFIIKATDAAIIADVMLGGDGSSPDENLSEISISAVQEAMNQMMGTAATSMSTIFNKTVDISPPSIIEGSIESDIDEIFSEDAYVKVFFRLIVGDLIDSNMMQLIPMSFASELVEQLLNADSENDQSEGSAEVPTKETMEQPVTSQQQTREQSAPSQAHHEQPINVHRHEERQTQYLGNNFDANNATIEQAAFSSFDAPTLSSNEKRNLDMLLDISLKVTVELGRTKKSIKDILDLSSGSIIELDKLAGEPVDILVNDKLVAEGEVIVIEENFGVRVTDIISQSDRLMKLK